MLEAFTPDRPRLTLADAAKATDMTRASARRILLTLQELGYVGSDDRWFYLRPRVLQLGFAYLSAIPWGPVALPYMKEIVLRLNESCSAAVLDDDNVIYVGRIPALRMTSITLGLGAKVPAYCTATGQVLLAGLGQSELDAYLARVRPVAHTPQTITDLDQLAETIASVRDQGFALSDQQLRIGVRSIAVPLRNVRNRVVAALNISAERTRVDIDRITDEFLPALRQAATAISSAITTS